ncbi:MAG TPA: hypothetical protein VMU81_00280 [Acetobacteraceae bacterium]|nr:hypothetical protein [Acetobacteraceae bacterium]
MLVPESDTDNSAAGFCSGQEQYAGPPRTRQSTDRQPSDTQDDLDAIRGILAATLVSLAVWFITLVGVVLYE